MIYIFRYSQAHFLSLNVKDLISDLNEKKNLTAFEADSIVINCPISSIPDGNFSWYFNNNEMNFDAGLKQKDIRYIKYLGDYDP